MFLRQFSQVNASLSRKSMSVYDSVQCILLLAFDLRSWIQINNSENLLTYIKILTISFKNISIISIFQCFVHCNSDIYFYDDYTCITQCYNVIWKIIHRGFEEKNRSSLFLDLMEFPKNNLLNPFLYQLIQMPIETCQ